MGGGGLQRLRKRTSIYEWRIHSDTSKEEEVRGDGGGPSLATVLGSADVWDLVGEGLSHPLAVRQLSLGRRGRVRLLGSVWGQTTHTGQDAPTSCLCVCVCLPVLSEKVQCPLL